MSDMSKLFPDMDDLIDHLMEKSCGDECFANLRVLEADPDYDGNASNSKTSGCVSRQNQTMAIKVSLLPSFLHLCAYTHISATPTTLPTALRPLQLQVPRQMPKRNNPTYRSNISDKGEEATAR